ncbi:MAG TPA: c-type cytochrome domain-containing protein [Pirellulales bacterium]|nr:c-type cytochrome domain-containing protein [Pirellulales bacterium]
MSSSLKPCRSLWLFVWAATVGIAAFAADNANSGKGPGIGQPGIGQPGVPSKASNPFADDVPAKSGPADSFPDKNLSFTKNIAPILVSKCTRCHIDQARGKFSMATFESLKKGTPDGPVFVAGKSGDSRMVEALTSGDMPRAGPKATKPEITAISRWIDEGAKFDGPDEKTPLVKLTSATASPPLVKKSDEPKLSVVSATGRETVQFSKDIAPVLVENCFGCHTGPGPTGNFQMARFTDMIRGGQSGNPWVPMQPADSLLIKKLKGTAGNRMPQPKNKPPLPDDVIAKFEKWIAEGATFDGGDPNQSTLRLAALTRAKIATPEELASDRLTAAKHMWRLTDPKDPSTTKQTKNLLIVSNLPEGELQEVAQTAEQQVAAVTRLLHAPADQPLVRGGITLFVFPGRYDYSEFGRMVEGRAYPKDWRGHWKYDTVDAYAALVPPVDSGDYSLAGMIQQQLAAIYLASLAGNPPDWFSEGSGRVLASRVDFKSERVRNWNDRLKELAAASKLETFVTHGLPPDDNDIAAYGFMKEAMANAGKYSQLVIALRGGQSFDNAFAQIYGSPPQALAAAWAASIKGGGT